MNASIGFGATQIGSNVDRVGLDGQVELLDGPV